MFAVFPLLLLFCICGGAAAAAAANFPFDAKEHLIVYNTEGQGDDKVCVPTRQLHKFIFMSVAHFLQSKSSSTDHSVKRKNITDHNLNLKTVTDFH